MDLGTTFLAKKQIFNDFGVPGRSLGKALGRILAGKFGDEKKVRKKVVKVIASAGDADPGKEGFREDKGQVGKIQHAFVHRRAVGGRIEPAEPEAPPAEVNLRVGCQSASD